MADCAGAADKLSEKSSTPTPEQTPKDNLILYPFKGWEGKCNIFEFKETKDLS